MLVTEYALQFPNGLYFTGRVNSYKEPTAWQGERHHAFTYTEQGAHTKTRLGPFKNCTVVKVL